MDCQIIYVPSEAQRHKAAEDACDRHNKLAPIEYNSRGIYKCCGVKPEYRNGGAVLGSFTCPVCKRHEGIWSQNWIAIQKVWNHGIYCNTWRVKDGVKPVEKRDFITAIDGYEDGWRYVNSVDFRLAHNSIEYHSYEYRYPEYSNEFRIDGAIMRYNVDTNFFEFWYNNNLFTLEYNPPKSGGCISYGYEGNYILDNDKERKYAKHHDKISFSAFNYKWSEKLKILIDNLRKD